jgi:hypothetical protein
MSYSAIQRTQLIVPWPIFSGVLTNIDIAPGLDYTDVIVPGNWVLKAWQVSGINEGTAASQVVIAIYRGGGVGVGTALTTSAAATMVAGGATPVRTTGLNIPLVAGETLTMVALGSDADTDDLDNVTVTLEVQIVPDA